LEQRITTQNQQNWLAKLLGYEFKIYKASASNKVADALSCSMDQKEKEDTEMNIISKPYWPDMERIEEEVQNNPMLQKIMTGLKENPESNGHYTLDNGRLDSNVKTVISKSMGWITKLMKEFHTTLMGDIPRFLAVIGE